MITIVYRGKVHQSLQLTHKQQKLSFKLITLFSLALKIGHEIEKVKHSARFSTSFFGQFQLNITYIINIPPGRAVFACKHEINPL